MGDYLPRKESELMDWARSFNAQIVATPTVFGLTAGQATIFTGLWESFRDAYEIATAEPTRTAGTIQTKNTTKDAMIDGDGGIRELVKIIQAYPGTTDTMRVDLQITVPDVEPTPVPAPSMPPSLEIDKQLGRSVRVRLRDMENPTRRGKPAGVLGASVFMWVGDENPPEDPMEWTYLFNTSTSMFTIDFPSEVASGSKVWLTTQWFNRRQETSPPSAFQSVRVGDAMAQTLKKAA